MNKASRTSFGKETAPKYDYCCSNDHFAYQTPFDFDDNLHWFKKDQYLATVGARILKKKYFAQKYLILCKKCKTNIKNSIGNNQNPFLKFRLPQLLRLLSLSARRHQNEISFDMPNNRCHFPRNEFELSNSWNCHLPIISCSEKSMAVNVNHDPKVSGTVCFHHWNIHVYLYNWGCL